LIRIDRLVSRRGHQTAFPIAEEEWWGKNQGGERLPSRPEVWIRSGHQFPQEVAGMTEHWEQEAEDKEDDLICMNGRTCEHPCCPEHGGDEAGWSIPAEELNTMILFSK